MQQALPQRCMLCAGAAHHDVVCAACTRGLARVARPCRRCALFQFGKALDSSCVACRPEPPPWSHASAAFAYAFPLDQLVQALKYRGDLALAGWFGARLADAVAAGHAPRVDAVVPLPLAAARQRMRGFNQAVAIARTTAARLGVPRLHALLRTRATAPQATLPWAARAANLAGAFSARPAVRGLRCAIVDDVMTTGATLTAATHALLAAGAIDVHVWVVARTL